MRSLLILTDFSEASFRAAEYACALVDNFQMRRVVLYHAYQTAIAVSDLPVGSVATNRKIHLEAMEALSLVSDRLKSMMVRPVTIDLIAEDAFLPETINERCREQDIDLVVMGGTGRSGVERWLLGDTTARMLATCRCPILVVPEHAALGKPIGTVLFTTDLKDLPEIQCKRLYPMLDGLRAKLSVLHVGQTEVQASEEPEIRAAVGELHRLLDRYHPTYHYLGGEDVAKLILDFAAAIRASLIFAIPREHGFLSSLFPGSVSKKLAHNSPVPLLFFPEE